MAKQKYRATVRTVVKGVRYKEGETFYWEPEERTKDSKKQEQKPSVTWELVESEKKEPESSGKKEDKKK